MRTQLTILGNVGREPELRYTASGTAVCNFTVATNESHTKKDGSKVQDTVWYRVSAWGAQAEACSRYVKKGDRIYVEAKFSPDPETGCPKIYVTQDGEHRANYDVNATYVVFLGERREEPEADPYTPHHVGDSNHHPTPPATPPAAEVQDDLPF